MLAQNMFKINAEVTSKHYLHNAFAEVRFFLLSSSAFALCHFGTVEVWLRRFLEETLLGEVHISGAPC